MIKAETKLPEKDKINDSVSQILVKSLGYINNAEKYDCLVQVKAEQWQPVVELARHHEVSPLLYHCLKPLALKLPKKINDELREDYLNQALKNLYLYRELGNLLEELHANDLPVVVLKGAYLAEAVYENIGLRGMSDVDLLVKEENLEQVERILSAKGGVLTECFRGFDLHDYHNAYYFTKSNLKIEIHWALHSPEDPWQIDLEEIWKRAQTVTLIKAPACTLAPEDLILYICMHSVKHAPFHMHLRMLIDLGEIIRCFDAEVGWKEISLRARRWGLVRPIYLLLRLASELLKTPVPAEWLATLTPSDFDECYLTDIRSLILADRSEYFATNSGRVLVKLNQERGLNSKIKMLHEKLFPSTENTAINQNFSIKWHKRYLFYSKRLIKVFVRYGIAVARLALREDKTRSAASRADKGEKLRDWLASG